MMFSAAFRRAFRADRPGHVPIRARKSRPKFEILEARDVPATGLGVANDFSAFVLHDLNVNTSDVQGRVAVGGNASLTAYGLGDHLSNSHGTRDDLIVGGNLTFTNGQVFFGNIVYGGTGTFDLFGHPNGAIRQAAVMDFADAGTQLLALSDSYAALAPTGTVRDRFGTIVLVGTNAGQNVFNVPASMLWNAFDIIIQTPTGSSAIVNIAGTEARMQFMGFHLNGVAKENVILNFPQATHVTFQGIGINANVLAPRAAVDFNNGQLNGNLVASSWSGFGQINAEAPPPSTEPPPCTCPPPPPSDISGMVFFDQNKDGLPQDLEMRFPAVAVTLTGQDHDGNPLSLNTQSDSGGIFKFTGLAGGVYSIQVTTPDGYLPGTSSAGAFGGTTAPNSISGITIIQGQGSGGYNFAEIRLDQPPPPPLPPSQISGMVYVDVNHDGQPQDSETRLQGVTVTLTGEGGNPTFTTTTDAGGIYSFAVPVGGAYAIAAATPNGYMAGTSTVGAFGGTPQPGIITGISIVQGQGSGGYNFAEVVCDAPPPGPSQLSGMVYEDQNQDGQPQDNEMRFANNAMTLSGIDLTGASVFRTTTTDAGGIYVFSDLPAGTYSLTFTLPDGYRWEAFSVGAFGGQSAPKTNIFNIVIPAGQSSGGYNFGLVLDCFGPM
jgi:choice-of-anchor A domain-containing protein